MRYCEVCGGNYSSRISAKRTRFCSRECYQIWRSEQRRKKMKYDMKAQRKLNGLGRSSKKTNGDKRWIGMIKEEEE